MQRLFTLLTVFLFSATLTFAQQSVAEGDHDDSAPIQSGYAVVTPVVVTATATSAGTTATTGLVVFETFGLRLDGGVSTTQAGVLPPGLTTDALLFAERDDRIAKNLGVAIVNPNSSALNVNLTLNDSNGKPIVTGTVMNIPSYHQVAEMVSDLFTTPLDIPNDLMGTLVVNSASNLPFSVIGLRFRGANFSTIPATNLAPVSGPLPTITTGVGGPGAVMLPQFTAGAGWETEIVMINTNSSAMTVRVDLFQQNGMPLTTGMNGQKASSFMNIVIPAGGVFELAPRDADGDDDF